jgi:hypothetical protein
MQMSSPSDLKFEIGHVLFMDIVGYSKLVIDKQTELTRKLNGIVRDVPQFDAAEAEGSLVRLPTGDGIAVVAQPGNDNRLSRLFCNQLLKARIVADRIPEWINSQASRSDRRPVGDLQ